jgi:hypothetical protein
MRSSIRLLGAVALIILSEWTAAAPLPASWSGVLRDAAGSPVSGATVTLTGASGNPAYTAKTAPAGEFAFPNISPSKYKISVATLAASFKSTTSIEIKDGAKLAATLQLSSPEKGLVFIQEGSTASQASGGERLSSSEVSSLPLNSRDFSKLLLLAAGTMTDANGAANFTQQFAVCAGPRDHVGVARRAVPDIGQHDAGIGLHFLNGVDVEVGKSGAAHFPGR